MADTTKDKILTYALTPLSWIYGAVVSFRNYLFDKDILKSERFNIPVITVGNLTVGGTGKTPHVEYLIDYLSAVYNVAVLSRGYMRKTKGFVLACDKSTPDTIGDEPYQIYQKYGFRVKVAVCENRKTGIHELQKIDPNINLVILDDGFQHRFIKPKVSILLTEYNRPFYTDKLLPLGRLREAIDARHRAHFVIVTKCPENITPLNCRIMINNLGLRAFQKTFFTRYTYNNIMPVFPNDSPYSVQLSSLTADDGILLVSGIDNPRGFIKYFRQFNAKVKIAHYPDHHDFTRKDIENISKTFAKMNCARKLIITTEKDAARLACNPYFPHELKPRTFYLPISVHMINRPEEGDFMQMLKKLIDATEH